MQTYIGHKKIQAFKIADIITGPGGTALIGLGKNESVPVDAAYMQKHQPQIGGYYVRYEDGYESWSPADAFEKAYAVAVPVSTDDLGTRFGYHQPPTAGIGGLHSLIRTDLEAMARKLERLTPPGRERATMLTKLEEAMFWANAAIARDHVEAQKIVDTHLTNGGAS